MSFWFFFQKTPTLLVYKLCRLVDGKLYPLYVNANKEITIGEWLQAECGQLADENHVKSCGCGGRLALRPGWHTTTIPWTDWIGIKMPDGTLARKPNHVWCECEIRGEELNVESRNGLKTIPNGYYRFKTNSKQRDPWLISGEIKVNRILSNEEVADICIANGLIPQKVLTEEPVIKHEEVYMKKKLENYILKKVVGGKFPLLVDGSYYYYNDGNKIFRSRQHLGDLKPSKDYSGEKVTSQFFINPDAYMVQLPSVKEIEDGIKNCNSRDRIGVRVSKDAPLVNARWLKDAMQALNSKVMYVRKDVSLRCAPVYLFEDDDLQSDNCLVILPIGTWSTDEWTGYKICA